jgi:hypothetical protein
MTPTALPTVEALYVPTAATCASARICPFVVQFKQFGSLTLSQVRRLLLPKADSLSSGYAPPFSPPVRPDNLQILSQNSPIKVFISFWARGTVLLKALC